MKEEYKVRFSLAPWAKKTKSIIIGGCGGIGSWVTLALARIGHDLYVFDDDDFDENNIGGQLCKITDVGVAKVEAVNDIIKQLCGSEINVFNNKYSATSTVAPIMISAFDNMEARKLMFEKWANQEDREIFLDGRMTSEYFEVYAVQKGMEDRYREHLFSSAEANDLPCNNKSTTHNGMGIAYIMTGVLNNYLSEDFTGMREVPFCTKMNIGLFMFEIEN